jgi:general secretion pathway protein A
LKSTPDPDDVLVALKRLVIAAPETGADTDIRSALAEIDAAMARSAAAEREDAPPTAPSSVSPFPAVEARRADPAPEPERRIDIAAKTKEPPAPPIASGAEYRSRLNWFIGVADVSAQDPGSLTYEPFFGLREKPFSLSADPRFFYSRASHGAAFDTLAAGIRRREGVLVLSGEVGTGKTTLCRAVLESLDQKTFAAFVPDPFLSREDLLKTLLVDFGVVSVEEVRSGRLRGASRADLSYPLYEFLASLQPLRAFAVVMIDEAQNLKAELLEEIRALSDLENGQKLLEVVLVGQPELQSRLAASEMRQLSQRVSIRCELAPLAAGEVEPYIWHRLRVAGHDGRLQFASDAIDLIAAASSGIPRVVNLICDRALLQAARARKTMVDAQHVATAIGELKLPIASAAQRPMAHARIETPSPAPRTASSASVESTGDPFNQFLKEFRPAPGQESEEDKPRAVEVPVVTAPVAVAPAAAPVAPAPEVVFPQSGRLVRARKLPPLAPPPERGADETFWSSAANPPAASASAVEREPLAMATTPNRGRWIGVAGVCLAVAAGLLGFRYSKVPARPLPSSVEQSAPQSVEAPTPAIVKTSAPADATPAEPPVRFAVQMATFRTSRGSEQSVQELSDAGYKAYSAEKSLSDGSHVFAVLLGPYDGRPAAEQDRDRAKQVPGYGTGLIVQLGTP